MGVLVLVAPQLAFAADDVKLTYKNGSFTPPTLTIPAGQKVKLVMVNEDASPMEFESHALHREKVVSANSQAVLTVGPLKAGTYAYYNDFNEKAKGAIVAE